MAVIAKLFLLYLAIVRSLSPLARLKNGCPHKGVRP